VADNAASAVSISGIYMNMVTKSGSNTLHGQAAAYYATAATQASPNLPTFNGSPVNSGSRFSSTATQPRRLAARSLKTSGGCSDRIAAMTST